MSLSEVGAYAKAGSAKTTRKMHQKIARVEKRGTSLKWRMTKKMDQKIQSQLAKSIEASHLYPAAKIIAVDENKETGEQTLTLQTGTDRISELRPWILITNGSGNETAAVVHFECEDGKTATTTGATKISKAKLKGAYIYFGPQPQLKYNESLASDLMAGVTAFPKSKQKIQLLPATYEKLQRELAVTATGAATGVTAVTTATVANVTTSAAATTSSLNRVESATSSQPPKNNIPQNSASTAEITGLLWSAAAAAAAADE